MSKAQKIIWLLLITVLLITGWLGMVMDNSSYIYRIINDIRVIDCCYIGFFIYETIIKPRKKY